MDIAIGNTHLAFRCNMAQLAVSPTVSAGFAHAFVEFAVGRGAQRAKLLSAGGPGLAELDDPDARVPLGAFQALVTAGKTLTGKGEYPAVVDMLGKLGKDGWEVVTCVSSANWLFWTLKRPA